MTILPVVTKDLPISPRFTPYDFLSRCKFSTLTTCQPMVEFYLLARSHAFRYERKNTNPTLVRIELTTSALARVQVTYQTTRATSENAAAHGRKWGKGKLSPAIATHTHTQTHAKTFITRSEDCERSTSHSFPLILTTKYSN